MREGVRGTPKNIAQDGSREFFNRIGWLRSLPTHQGCGRFRPEAAVQRFNWLARIWSLDSVNKAHKRYLARLSLHCLCLDKACKTLQRA